MVRRQKAKVLPADFDLKSIESARKVYKKYRPKILTLRARLRTAVYAEVSKLDSSFGEWFRIGNVRVTFTDGKTNRDAPREQRCRIRVGVYVDRRDRPGNPFDMELGYFIDSSMLFSNVDEGAKRVAECYWKDLNGVPNF